MFLSRIFVLSLLLAEGLCQYQYSTYNTDYTEGSGTTGAFGTTSDYPTYPETEGTVTQAVVTNPPPAPQTTLQPASPSLSVLELILLLPIILQFLTPFLGVGGNISSGSGSGSGSVPAIPSVPPLSGRPSQSLQGGFNFYPHPLFSTGGNLLSPLMFFPRRGPKLLRRSKRELTRSLDLGKLELNRKGDGPQRKLKKPTKKMFKKKERAAKLSKKSVGVTLYKRLPVPGSDKFVTIKSKDISQSVNIFYDKKMLKLKTSDIIKMTNMRTIPDMIKILKSYKLDV